MAYRGGPGNVDGPGEITGRATFRKRVTYLEGALDLSSVSDAIPWSGGHVFLDQNGGARVITLPTATSAAEGNDLTGWYIEVSIAYEVSNNCTIVRGDTSNDFLTGMVATHTQDNLTGVTIGSHVITFVSGQSVIGDYAKIVCYSADANNTYFVAHCLSST